MFNPGESRADYVLGSIWQQLLPWQCFQDFQVLNFVGVPQPLPKHGFLPNFQDMFKSRGSTANQVLGSIMVTMARFLHVWGLKVCQCSTGNIHTQLFFPRMNKMCKFSQIFSYMKVLKFKSISWVLYTCCYI